MSNQVIAKPFTGLVINLSQLLTNEDYTLNAELEPYLNKVLSVTRYKDFIANGSAHPYHDLRKHFGGFFNNKALLVALINPELAKHGLSTNMFIPSTYSQIIYQIDPKLDLKTKNKIKQLLAQGVNIEIPEERINSLILDLYPYLNEEEHRLYMTLYYSLEVDNFIRSVNSEQTILDSHTYLLELTRNLSLEYNSEKIRLFNELLENNTTYGASSIYADSRPTFQTILTQTKLTVDKLLN